MNKHTNSSNTGQAGSVGGATPKETCDCAETSCPKGCTKHHTHKTFFCETCNPPDVTPKEEELTNNGKPHVCNIPQSYTSTKGKAWLCPKCNMIVDEPNFKPIDVDKIIEDAERVAEALHGGKEEEIRKTAKNLFYSLKDDANHDDEDIGKIVRVLFNIRREAIAGERERTISILNKWTPKEKYLSAGGGLVKGLTLDDHKRNFADELVRHLTQE